MTPSQTAHPTEGNLLPCPFCGGDLTITKHFRDQMWQGLHRCKVVGAIQFEWTGDYNRIVTAWNTRPDVRPQGEEGLWRPISEAPRDGTWFLACATQPGWGATRIVRYQYASDRLPIHGEGNMWPSPPTHWQPLPAPPALSNQGKPSS